MCTLVKLKYVQLDRQNVQYLTDYFVCNISYGLQLMSIFKSCRPKHTFDSSGPTRVCRRVTC